jgi:hypothetical protein
MRADTQTATKAAFHLMGVADRGFIFALLTLMAWGKCPVSMMSHGHYRAVTIVGGFHVPAPGGRIDGGSTFGQYSRMTR